MGLRSTEKVCARRPYPSCSLMAAAARTAGAAAALGPTSIDTRVKSCLMGHALHGLIQLCPLLRFGLRELLGLQARMATVVYVWCVDTASLLKRKFDTSLVTWRPDSSRCSRVLSVWAAVVYP